MQANVNAYQAWRRTFSDPSTVYNRDQFEAYIATYNLLWAYYNNSIFDKYNSAIWEAYKQGYNLYRFIRPARNPTWRLVKFYAGILYPGLLVEDDSELDEGMQSAMPFGNKVTSQVKAAVAQIWQWSNWQSNKSVYVEYGAALGDVFLEVIDDLERGKVYINVLWPGFIYDLDLDQAGNVKAYTIEYQAHDDDGPYRFKKEVDQVSFRYYRDDKLYRTIENIYGFVPGVWVNQAPTGTLHGAPAITGSQEKIDELNNLVSQTHDHIKKALQSPQVFATSNPGGVKKLFDQPKRGATSEFDPTKGDDRESVQLFSAPADTKVQPLLSPLDLAGSAVQIVAQEMEIQKDHPELGFYDQLRQMTQLTGPAASRIVGDVKASVYAAMAQYDRGIVAALQMCLTIAGMRANSGAWGPLTDEQEKLRPFNLDSFKRGDMYLKFKPRPILTPTKLEIAQESLAFWQGIQAADTAGVPIEIVLEDAGWTPEKLAKLRAEKEARAERIRQDQMLAQDDMLDPIEQ